jgi:hypothetical protein
MYQVILTVSATVSRRHKSQKQMCSYETERAYTSADIDVWTDVDINNFYGAKVLIISR